MQKELNENRSLLRNQFLIDQLSIASVVKNQSNIRTHVVKFTPINSSVYVIFYEK